MRFWRRLICGHLESCVGQRCMRAERWSFYCWRLLSERDYPADLAIELNVLASGRQLLSAGAKLHVGAPASKNCAGRAGVPSPRRAVDGVVHRKASSIEQKHAGFCHVSFCAAGSHVVAIKKTRVNLIVTSMG